MGHKYIPLQMEQTVIEAPIHWKNYLMPMMLMVICSFSTVFRAYFMQVSLINRIVGMTVVPAEYQPLLSAGEIGLLVLLAAIAVLSMIRTSRIRYYVTNKRIIALSGLFTLNCQEMLLSRIEAVYLNQNIYERMYDCGDILCAAPGSQVFLDDVQHAEAFKQTLMSLINKVRDAQ